MHCYAWNGHQYCCSELLPQSESVITQVAWPQITDVPFTLTFRMGQRACHICCCLKKRPIPHLGMSQTSCPLDHPSCKAENSWHCIGYYCQNGAMAVLLSFVPIKTADTLVMHNSDQINIYLAYFHYQHFLTLYWHLCSELGIDYVAFCLTYKGW